MSISISVKAFYVVMHEALLIQHPAETIKGIGLSPFTVWTCTL